MGSLDKRIEALERSLSSQAVRVVTEERRAEMRARLQQVIEQEEEKRRRAGLPPWNEVLTWEERAKRYQEFVHELRRRAKGAE